MSNEAGIVQFEVLSRHVHGGAKEIHEIPQSGYPVVGRDLKPRPPNYETILVPM
jgi:hypothetical protein